MKWLSGCHLAKQWASTHKSHQSLLCLPLPGGSLCFYQPIMSIWDQRPGVPMLTIPRGIIDIVSYVNGILEHNMARQEDTMNGVQHEWSWLPKQLRFPCTLSGQAMISKSNLRAKHEMSAVSFWHWLITRKQSLIIITVLSAQKLKHTLSATYKRCRVINLGTSIKLLRCHPTKYILVRFPPGVT